MALRAGRIYPVHLVILSVMVAMELLLMTTDLRFFTDRQPFRDARSVDALVSNLLMLHSFGVHDRLTWNAPSWSIAAEMWTYLVFALTFATLGRNARLPFLMLGVAALIFLILYSPHHLNTTYQYGFLRAVFGFSLGVGIQYLYERGHRPGGSLLEIAIVALSILFVWLAGESWFSFVGPFLFALAVWVFASERGVISSGLRGKSMMLLGTVSYSLYMVHAFVQARLGELIQMHGGWIGASLDKTQTSPEFSVEAIVAPPLVGDALTLVMLAMVIGLSVLSYRWIEHPCREWTRVQLNKLSLKRT
jgi:peptidoglycan/LPS O-acetylase OafA/YrhL